MTAKMMIGHDLCCSSLKSFFFLILLILLDLCLLGESVQFLW